MSAAVRLYGRRGLLLLILLVAFALRLHNLDAHSLWYDELLQLDIAQGALADIAPQLKRHAAMPLDYFISHFWVMLGRQEMWVRFPALVFGTLSVALIYTLARQMFNRRVGVASALLLAVSFFGVRYSQEARPYALLLFCTLLTFWGVWQAYDTNRYGYWPVVIVGLLGAALSHYFALFLLVPLGLFVAARQFAGWRQETMWGHTLLFGLALVLLLLMLIVNGRAWILYSVGERFSREFAQPELYTLPAPEKPNRGQGPPLTVEFWQTKVLTPLAAAPAPALLGYLVLALLGAASVGRSNLSPDRRAAVWLLLGWLLLPLLLIYLFLLHRGTFYAIRYILYTLPPFLMLTAYGLDKAGRLLAARCQSLRCQTATKQVLPALLLMLLVSGQLTTLTRHFQAAPYEDWRAVARLLTLNAAPDDAVIAVNAQSAINWYYPPAAQPVGSYSRSVDIWQTLREHPRRWFVLSSYSRRRDDGLREWLHQQQAVKIAIDRRVVIYFHQQGQSGAQMAAQVAEFELPAKE